MLILIYTVIYGFRKHFVDQYFDLHNSSSRGPPGALEASQMAQW